MPAAIAFAFPPPAIAGVGTAGGFTLVLEDRSGKEVAFLAANGAKFMEAARKRPEIASVNNTFLPSAPQLFINVDRDLALKQGVGLVEVYKTLETFMGGYFVNYFNRFGRQWRVYVEAALTGARTRLRPILMTSFAFILGSAPLWFATGAGAVSRRILGTVVIGGMLAATCIAVYLIPVTFFVIERFASHRRQTARETTAPRLTSESPREISP